MTCDVDRRYARTLVEPLPDASAGSFSLDPAGLDRLTLYPYRVDFVAAEPVHAAPTQLPNMLRGGFEISFRRLVCHDLDLECRACVLVRECPYPSVFRPSPPEGSAAPRSLDSQTV